MTNAIDGTRKRGRPATGSISIHLRMEPREVAALDRWVAERGGEMTRQEAVRLIVDTRIGEIAMKADDFKKAVLDLAVNAKESFEPGGIETINVKRDTLGAMTVTFNFRRLRDEAAHSQLNPLP